MIIARHLTKKFGNITALDDLSFEIKPGEIVGLLGPNGAGKSTTMRILTGFLSADSGEVIINDIDVALNSTEVQKQIGYLPENNPLYKEMLVGELLTYSADLKQIPHSERKTAFDFVVSAVGISEVFYRNIAELSKGYKQRVGIAIALLHQPQILILDEPTEGLDPNQRQEIRLLIRKLAKNRTIILSTHVMQEVEAVCERLLIINRGTLVADGKPKTLAKTGTNQIRIEIDIEGKDVVKQLKLIKDAKVIVRQTKNNRVSATIVTLPKFSIQPQLSKLAHTNKWIIWKVVESERHLEDVFQELTK